MSAHFYILLPYSSSKCCLLSLSSFLFIHVFRFNAQACPCQVPDRGFFSLSTFFVCTTHFSFFSSYPRWLFIYLFYYFIIIFSFSYSCLFACLTAAHLPSLFVLCHYQAWLTEIHEYAQQDVVLMLLGNKARHYGKVIVTVVRNTIGSTFQHFCTIYCFVFCVCCLTFPDFSRPEL